MLCCQPEPIPGSLTARVSALSHRHPCRQSCLVGTPHLHAGQRMMDFAQLPPANRKDRSGSPVRKLVCGLRPEGGGGSHAHVTCMMSRPGHREDGIEPMAHKRPALPHQPDGYLEPKWLRYQFICASMLPNKNTPDMIAPQLSLPCRPGGLDVTCASSVQ